MRNSPDVRLFGQGEDAAMYWDHMNGWGWAMVIVWSAVWIGFLGVLVWAATQWARRSPDGRPVDSRPGKSAHDLLDERLALGEIDSDEYHRRREALEQRPPVGV